MRLALAFLTMLLISMDARAAEPDIIVTQDGDPLKVYNLDIASSDNVYYTLFEDPNAPLQKISKTSILIIKKADGAKIDPSENSEYPSEIVSAGSELKKQPYTPITFYAIEDGFVDLKYNITKGMGNYIGMKKRYLSYHPEIGKGETMEKFILAANEEGSALNFRLISKKDRTLAVAPPRTKDQVKQSNSKRIEYEKSEYTIPDYVMVGDIKYSVIEVDPRAFLGKMNIKNITFPETLRIIGPRAFENCRLKKIILPESIDIVGDLSFYSNLTDDFKEIYIPKGIKEIGNDCFRAVGLQLSPRQYTEAYLSSIPDFITTENCTDFGIDDNAIESYERRKR